MAVGCSRRVAGRIEGLVQWLLPVAAKSTTMVLPHPPHFLPSQVWKDVDGVLTSDPRIVPNTLPVNELTFEEATELAYFGAQVRGYGYSPEPALFSPAGQTTP